MSIMLLYIDFIFHGKLNYIGSQLSKIQEPHPQPPPRKR